MAYPQPPQGWPLGQHDALSPTHGASNDHPPPPPAHSASDDYPPPPPAHGTPVGLHAQQQRPYADPNNYSDYSTPGSASEREGGRPMGVPERSANASPFNDQSGYEQPMIPRPMYSQRPYGASPAGMYSSSSSMHSMPLSPPTTAPYADTPYNRYSSSAQNLAPQLGQINPYEVDNDDDWGMGPETNNTAQHKRRSFVPFGGSRESSSRHGSGSPGSSINNGAAGAAVAGAALGTSAYAASRDGNGKYNAVPIVHGSGELIAEKSSWKAEDDLKKRKKRMWIAIAIITLILAGAILGGVLGATIGKVGGKDASADKAAQSDNDVAKDNKEDLGKDSSEIKAMMNNPDLHKVFPGMDYTPLNTQYPDCLHVKPSQNNITRDMAVMSQLTDAVRLYGTDCNQTQMMIHAIDRLEIKDTMKIWLGVWLDSNDTTTNRQIAQTWTILDDYGCDYFKGIIIGNEVLYRKDLTETELLTHVTEFRKNITDHKCKLPVAMADLGDNWTGDMATQVDIVMSNVHPFFAGIDVSEAAAWTWNFWEDHDVKLTANSAGIHQIIAEVGWPSGGGTNCGAAPTCDKGSVAGVDEMNQFMEDWICPSMANATEYFWFSAFDEPWKVRFNTKGKEWEDKWGLMDIDRNLKPGIKIPDCGGKSLPTSYDH
ncbi:glycoside hydrolase [Clathrospora elynae]|uniref:glucan endo-1,3-beta-D-glucosidase n=1 Tax=Clathrospora elynae TaxID=706981 RepID=A0A6A5SEE4_9PLEO|nr:glycoside hydrolase [Clathrospora elynae]